jgi:hypothetical protein
VKLQGHMGDIATARTLPFIYCSEASRT